MIDMFMRAVHPGAILREELEELGITPAEFARQINVPANRISQIIAGKRSITGDTALRFEHWFGVDPQFWMNLQTQFDLVNAETAVGEEIRKGNYIESYTPSPRHSGESRNPERPCQ